MILEPLNLEELFDIFDETSIRVLNYYMKKAILLQPETLVGQEPLPIQIPKEHMEQWILQAIGGKPVGAGNYPVDLIKGDSGFDIKMLSCKVDKNGELTNSDSGEASLAQKFTESGTSLDQLFKNKEYDYIVESWIDILESKFDKVINEYNLKNIYYIFILRAKNTFYLCGTKVNLNEIKSLKVKKVGEKSVFVDNLIDENFGNGKIYQSKKRLELRLKPATWVNSKYVMTFPIGFKVNSANLRELIEDGQISKLKSQICDKLMDNE